MRGESADTVAAELVEYYPSGIINHLIPCKAKRPVPDEWPGLPDKRRQARKDGRTTAAEIAMDLARWYVSDTSHNIGLVIPRGTVVLDADTRELAELLEERCPATTPVQFTSSGCHVVLRVPQDCTEIVATCKKEIEPGLRVDVRAGGRSQIIVWPSTHPDTGQPYTWMSRLPGSRAELPLVPYGWLKVLCKPRSSTYPAAHARPHFGSRAPADLQLSAIREGERNEKLFRRASALQGLGKSDDEIWSIVRQENDLRCSPPLPETELQVLVRSALRYPKGTQPLRPHHGQ